MLSESNSDKDFETQENAQSQGTALWKPLTRIQRRVLGVLIEKSKTTPDVYPMTINGIKTGCNQKSNRSPILELNEEQVENVLVEMRHLGCVIEIHSGGRVPKFKHQAYDWLNVNRSELGVMAELLLRGEQTVGELRARASRMEREIDSLETLTPILNSLIEKKLVLELTPAGRGQVVTHNLYQETELEKVKSHFSNYRADTDETNEEPNFRSRNVGLLSPASETKIVVEFEQLQQRVNQLESIVEQLQQQVSQLRELVEN